MYDPRENIYIELGGVKKNHWWHTEFKWSLWDINQTVWLGGEEVGVVWVTQGSKVHSHPDPLTFTSLILSGGGLYLGLKHNQESFATGYSFYLRSCPPTVCISLFAAACLSPLCPLQNLNKKRLCSKAELAKVVCVLIFTGGSLCREVCVECWSLLEESVGFKILRCFCSRVGWQKSTWVIIGMKGMNVRHISYVWGGKGNEV